VETVPGVKYRLNAGMALVGCDDMVRSVSVMLINSRFAQSDIGTAE